MTEEQKQVLKWYYSGKNYNEGVGLFTMFTRNKLMARIFPGREDRYREKLEYELCKSVKLDWKNMPELPEADSGDQNPEDIGKGGETTGTGDDPENTGEGGETTGTGDDPEAGTGNQNPEGSSDGGDPDPQTGKQTGSTENTEQGGTDTGNILDNTGEGGKTTGTGDDPEAGNQNPEGSSEGDNPDPEAGKQTGDQPSKTYPEEIEKILKEHSRLLGVRSDYHKQMSEVPEDNTPESVAKRKELSELIANCSAQIEKLYAAKEAFFVQGVMPNMEVLFPVPAAKKELKLPDDPEALAKMKKNLQNSIYKSQNQLEYQSDSKKDAPDPMPEGAQRIKLVKRIQANQATIEKINLKLAQRAD